jgi:hypothetical protein
MKSGQLDDNSEMGKLRLCSWVAVVIRMKVSTRCWLETPNVHHLVDRDDIEFLFVTGEITFSGRAGV